jgi:2-iminobutanoate/2-iminopropanoate deaminase
VKTIIATDGAPRAIGPYAQAVRAGDWLYCAGQIGLDPATGEMCSADVAEQTRRVILNLKAVIEAAGGTLANVVKTTVYLHELRHYPQVNEIYAEYFSADPPARAAVQVEALPREALVEIDAVAYLGG